MKTRSLKINIILNGIRQLLTVLFPLITVPYVTRTLGADAYGAFNFSYSIVSYVAYFAAFGIATYAVREGALVRNEQVKLNKICSQLFTINMLFTVAAFILLVGMIVFWRKLHPYTIYILVLSLSTLFTTLGMEWVNQIFEDYAFITIRYIIFQILSIVLLFVLVRQPEDLLKYCVIVIISSGGACLMNIFHVRKYVSVRFTRELDFAKHFRPLLAFFTNSLAGVIYVNSDITMLGIMVSNSSTGIYAFASKIYNIVKLLLASIVATAVPRITFLYNNDKPGYANYMRKIYLFLVLLVPISTIGLIFSSKYIVLIMSGTEFESGILALQILAAAIPFGVFGAYYSSLVLIIRGQEKIILTGTVTAASANVALNLILLKVYGFYGAAVTTLIAEAIVYAVSRRAARKYIRYNEICNNEAWKCVAIGSTVVAAMYFVVDKLTWQQLTSFYCILKFGIYGSVCFIMYFVLLRLSHDNDIRNFMSSLTQMLLKKK